MTPIFTVIPGTIIIDHAIIPSEKYLGANEVATFEVRYDNDDLDCMITQLLHDDGFNKL